MWKAAFTLSLLCLFSVQADARPRHHHHQHQHLLRSMALLAGDIPSDERVIAGRPSGCPHSFCGCEASLFRFGRIIPELNLASNWRRFPRAAPATGMAAVRSGHVMILQQHVSGDIWYVHDGNSGGHVTREHLIGASPHKRKPWVVGVFEPSYDGSRLDVNESLVTSRGIHRNIDDRALPIVMVKRLLRSRPRPPVSLPEAAGSCRGGIQAAAMMSHRGLAFTMVWACRS
jgi:hypothetical protein